MNRVHPLRKFYDIIDRSDLEYKKQNIPDFPYIVELEITNHCNFQCLMCRTGVGSVKRERGYMTDEIYRKLLDESKNHEIAFKFVGFGEPLLHPNSISYINQASEAGIVTHLTTNASKLDDDTIAELISSGLSSIKFSFQGVDREGYLLHRQIDFFDEMMLRIEKIYNLRGDRQMPYITIGTSVLDESEEEINAFRKKAEKIADSVQVGKTTLEFIETDRIKSENQRKRVNELREKQTMQKKRYPCCLQVWDVISVRYDGEITACCADMESMMALGNLETDSIMDAWTGSKLQGYRRILGDLQYDKLPLCKHCYNFMDYV